MKNKTPIIITITLIILIVLSLIIAVINKSADSNKEDKKTSNTESSQEVKESESESLTENTETETTGTGNLSQFIPEGATTEPAEKGGLMVTLENGITYKVDENGDIRMTAPQYREALKIDPTFMEKIDMNGDGLTYEDYKEKQANGTLTWEDMANLDSGEMSKEEEERRGADGLLCGDYKQREDGTKYIELDNGEILESGAELPGGGVWVDYSNLMP